MNTALTMYHQYVMEDVLGHIEGITSKKMFGGYGLYLDGRIFGIITGPDELRFKVDDRNRAQYEARGSTPYIYTGHANKKPVTMHYYLVPEEIQEDREQMEEWVRESRALHAKS